MSDGDGDSILAIFVLTIIVFFILEGTVFYEQPSCITTTINPYKFLLSSLVSGVIAVLIYLGSVELLNKIKEKIK